MKEAGLHEEIPFRNALFPIKIHWECRTKPKNDNAEDGENFVPPKGLWHEQLEILYFLDGCAIVECGFRRYTCRKGDIILINPCEPHMVLPTEVSAVYRCFMVDEKLFDTTANDLCALKYSLPLFHGKLFFRNQLSENQTVQTLIGRLTEECQKQESGFELSVKGIMFCLLSELYRQELCTTEKENDRGGSYLKIAPALQYIYAHYKNEISLETLAETCFMNPSYFCRRFREITGRTTADYIRDFRVSKAEALILSTDLSLTEISGLCGFSDSGYFSKSFRKSRGFSPTSLREKSNHSGKEEQTQ